ncbi:hypothetical protein [Nocardiopsis sp. NPDC006938]|uniref:effector-associated constant component EACC1 n=1 Tax=Nocardiopsis sp. NPDC006938 TaxID=3364337 RepID=UPI0036BD951B
MNVDEYDTWPEDWPEPEEKRYALLQESADPTNLTDIVMVTALASAFTVPLSKVVITWLKTKRSNVRVEVPQDGKGPVKIHGERLLNPQEFTENILRQIDASEAVKISWAEEKPKPPKKK